jgi:hypothetical protein
MTSYDPGVNDLVFHQTKRQRRYDIATLIVGASFAVLGFVQFLQSSDWALRVLWFAGACVNLLAVAAAPLERGRTIVTPQGVESVRRFRRRSWKWSEITGIDIKVAQYRNVPRWVTITTSSGKAARLPAPYEFSVKRDPDFDQHVAAIRERWGQATGRDPEREQAQDTDR